VTRYAPSRNYLSAGLIALALMAFSIWCALSWAPAAIPAGLFAASAILLLILFCRPAIEVHETHLVLGKRVIGWREVRRVDRTGWISPLVVYLTLGERERVLVVYPGDLDSANSLLRNLRRFATHALIDGIPYRQFWGEIPTVSSPRQLTPPKYQVLRPEDEAEVERLYQRLKTAGHLDPKKIPDEE
jgi:hypothetical protein